MDAYWSELIRAVEQVDQAAIAAAAALIFQSWEHGGRVVVFGNGGSMATASHLAADLSKWTEHEDGRTYRAIRAVALDSLPILTAYANDDSFGVVFGRQLRNVLDVGDVALAISCSGRSANIIAGLIAARQVRAKTILMTGDILRIAALTLADVVIPVEARDIRIQETMHLAIGQHLAGVLRARIEEGMT